MKAQNDWSEVGRPFKLQCFATATFSNNNNNNHDNVYGAVIMT